MIMTSVSGHLLNYEFAGGYKSWKSCNPVQLFDAPVVKGGPEQFTDIKVVKKSMEKIFLPILSGFENSLLKVGFEKNLKKDQQSNT